MSESHLLSDERDAASTEVGRTLSLAAVEEIPQASCPSIWESVRCANDMTQTSARLVARHLANRRNTNVSTDDPTFQATGLRVAGEV